MLAFQRGDESAFVQLYERYRARLVNYARRLLGNVAQGEEAAQDVFLKVYEHRARYQPRARFSTFIYRIATNHCLNLKARHDVRRTERDGTAEARAIEPGPDQEQQAADRELLARVQAELAALPESQRAALVLCHYQGLSGDEAAAVLSVSEQAVKNLIHRARATLAKRLAITRGPEVPYAVSSI